MLASTSDLVLRLAYLVGDFLSDVTYDDDSPWRMALGYHGPRPKALEHVAHAQIAAKADYGHGDYFASSSPAVGKPEKVGTFIREALLGTPHTWP